METLLLVLAVTGIASQYAPGVMDEVITNRQKWEQIPQDVSNFDGYIAVQNSGDIGKVFYIKPEGYDSWEKFLAVDCAGIADGGKSWMLRNNILVEVDYSTAERWDAVGRGKKIRMLTEEQYTNSYRYRGLDK